MAETESPVVVVIRRAVGDPVGVFWQRVKVRLQLGESHRLANRNAVADDMEVVASEIDNALSLAVSDEGVTDIPLPGDIPVENLCSGRYFMNIQRNVISEDSQRITKAVPRDTPANRK